MLQHHPDPMHNVFDTSRDIVQLIVHLARQPGLTLAPTLAPDALVVLRHHVQSRSVRGGNFFVVLLGQVFGDWLV